MSLFNRRKFLERGLQAASDATRGHPDPTGPAVRFSTLAAVSVETE